MARLYRPVAFLLLAFLCFGGKCKKSSPPPAPASSSAPTVNTENVETLAISPPIDTSTTPAIDAVVVNINDYRTGKGLSKLDVDAGLGVVLTNYSKMLAQTATTPYPLNHHIGGSSSRTRLAQINVSPVPNGLAEILQVAPDAATLQTYLLKQGYEQIMAERQWDSIGIGVDKGNVGWVWSIIFYNDPAK